jgi:hypothetical protein
MQAAVIGARFPSRQPSPFDDRASGAPVESAQRHQTFGPQAIAVGHFLTAEAGLIPDDDVLAALAEIRKRWPALSFRDFWGAAVLAQALALKPRGSA